MKITIGILAYNESFNIEKTLASLFEQTVFTSSSETNQNYNWSIVVVPNGCSDNTHEVAKNYLTSAVPKLNNPFISFGVVSLTQAGKSNAWNEFVHHISDADTDIFIFIDADIFFGYKETIENSLNLLHNSTAEVVVDAPLKFFDENAPKLIRTISERTSNTKANELAGIAGSFYCVRAETIREVWLPVGLSGEDGFVYSMMITNKFRIQPNPGLVIRAKNASHYFEGLTKLSSIIHHEVRLVIGTTLNCYLTWDTLHYLTNPEGHGAGYLIKELNQNKPNWYKDFITNNIKNRGYWVLPRGMFLRRLYYLKNLNIKNILYRIPLFLVSFIFDLYVFFKANSKLKSGQGIGFW